ncbi:suppressor of fused domain protein [Nonomuraea angiospora]|uniref:Suppressor of fused-like domain-containing protein n=1 Tax=Nonomuraea angiospora TaxID=46172 RepID=A0ABR9MBX6_9ACTN|nr:suppressor of fused domain protein [Nonomuraea angiospora]MBE1590022.1 hypothetical protein [Nonomuraea angiospora]
MPILIDHLERRLGVMEGGRRIAGLPEGGSLSIARFANGQLQGVVSYASIGLSNVPLQSRSAPRGLHMELIACEYQRDDTDDSLPSALTALAARLLREETAILRGEVVRLPGPLRPDSAMVGLYAALPVYFDPPFKSVVVENDCHVAVVWLVPVGAMEIRYIEKFGYPAFEGELVARAPDLLDLRRGEIV